MFVPVAGLAKPHSSYKYVVEAPVKRFSKVIAVPPYVTPAVGVVERETYSATRYRLLPEPTVIEVLAVFCEKAVLASKAGVPPAPTVVVPETATLAVEPIEEMAAKFVWTVEAASAPLMVRIPPAPRNVAGTVTVAAPEAEAAVIVWTALATTPAELLERRLKLLLAADEP